MNKDQLTEWLDKTKIEDMLSAASQPYFSRLVILDTIDSTNDYLLDQAKATSQSGIICLAEEQTKGRGRHGKTWFSPKGTNLYGSILWRFPAGLTDISHLSLAVSTMVLQALQRYGVCDELQCKWPNDIYINGRKLGGILIEGVPSQEQDYPVVIGIGLNLHQSAQHPFASTAISLEEVIGNKIARNQLAGLLVDEILQSMPHYLAQGFAPFISTWRAHDMLLNQPVALQVAQQTIIGTAHGINDAGELVIETTQGQRLAFHCGEVSVGFGKNA